MRIFHSNAIRSKKAAPLLVTGAITGQFLNAQHLPFEKKPRSIQALQRPAERY